VNAVSASASARVDELNPIDNAASEDAVQRDFLLVWLVIVIPLAGYGIYAEHDFLLRLAFKVLLFFLF